MLKRILAISEIISLQANHMLYPQVDPFLNPTNKFWLLTTVSSFRQSEILFISYKPYLYVQVKSSKDLCITVW